MWWREYVENNKIMKFWNKMKLNEYSEDGRMYFQIQSDVVYFGGGNAGYLYYCQISKLQVCQLILKILH